MWSTAFNPGQALHVSEFALFISGLWLQFFCYKKFCVFVTSIQQIIQKDLVENMEFRRTGLTR